MSLIACFQEVIAYTSYLIESEDRSGLSFEAVRGDLDKLFAEADQIGQSYPAGTPGSQIPVVADPPPAGGGNLTPQTDSAARTVLRPAVQVSNPVLIIESAQGSSSVEVNRDPFVLGRAIECNAVINDNLASRRHCRIDHRNDGLWYVVDLKSGNGTEVNNQPIEQQVLSDGDKLRVGDTFITFNLAVTDQPAAPMHSAHEPVTSAPPAPAFPPAARPRTSSVAGEVGVVTSASPAPAFPPAARPRTSSAAGEDGVSATDYENAKFAVCAWVDEAILTSSWEGRMEWLKQPLQRRFFNTTNAGEEFVERLRKLGPEKKSVREIYSLCLAMGFTGPFYQDDTAALEELKQHNYQHLWGGKPGDQELMGKSLFPAAYPTSMPLKKGSQKKWKWQPLVSLGLIFGTPLLVLILYWIYSGILDGMVQGILESAQ